MELSLCYLCQISFRISLSISIIITIFNDIPSRNSEKAQRVQPWNASKAMFQSVTSLNQICTNSTMDMSGGSRLTHTEITRNSEILHIVTRNWCLFNEYAWGCLDVQLEHTPRMMSFILLILYSKFYNS